MAIFLETKLDEVIQVVTTEGRVFSGILKSFDQSLNIVLDNCIEKVFSLQGTTIQSMNVYLIRGDSVALVSDLDMQNESGINFEQIKAEPIKSIKLHI